MTKTGSLLSNVRGDLFGGLALAFPVIVTTFFVAGALQVAIGVPELGRYVRNMPSPVVSGFMSGIGAIVVITQLTSLVADNVTETRHDSDREMLGHGIGNVDSALPT